MVGLIRSLSFPQQIQGVAVTYLVDRVNEWEAEATRGEAGAWGPAETGGEAELGCRCRLKRGIGKSKWLRDGICMHPQRYLSQICIVSLMPHLPPPP
jgi:hypothetical protein